MSKVNSIIVPQGCSVVYSNGGKINHLRNDTTAIDEYNSNEIMLAISKNIENNRNRYKQNYDAMNGEDAYDTFYRCNGMEYGNIGNIEEYIVENEETVEDDDFDAEYETTKHHDGNSYFVSLTTEKVYARVPVINEEGNVIAYDLGSQVGMVYDNEIVILGKYCN